MQKVLTAAEMREVDRLTTERYGIPSIILMENAAHAVARVITEKLGGSVKGKRILILCGKGNNGGDGAALARILWQQGACCQVFVVGRISESKGDAKTNFEMVWNLAKTQTGYFNTNETFIGINELEDVDQISEYFYVTSIDACVDALFGTGFRGQLDGMPRKIVQRLLNRETLSQRGTIRISVDLPSGVNADRNFLGSDLSDDLIEEQIRVLEVANSDVTVTFTAPKLASVLPPASRCSKELVVAQIGTPSRIIEEITSQLFLSTREDAERCLNFTKFGNSSYKNKRGHALLIAGSENYSGAAVLAANAAMRSGVGLVTLACPADAKTEIASRILPEVILATLGTPEYDELVPKANAIAIGPGLSATDPEIELLVRKIVEERTTPVIVDAGALWFFSRMQKPAREQGLNAQVGGQALTDVRASAPERCPLILTPHEGEFLRLLGDEENHPDGETPPPLLRKDGGKIKDRVAAVREFAQTNDVILVLKGERVLIGHPDGRVVVNPTGNSGLGKAGNGDTLAGILAGFVAQAAKMEIDIFETVVAAVYVAGMAGDIAEKKFGKRVMTASDVRECLAEVFAELEKG